MFAEGILYKYSMERIRLDGAVTVKMGGCVRFVSIFLSYFYCLDGDRSLSKGTEMLMGGGEKF